MKDSITFQEVKVKIAKIEKALMQLKQMPVQTERAKQVAKLELLRENYMKKLKVIKEEIGLKPTDQLPKGQGVVVLSKKDSTPQDVKKYTDAKVPVVLTKEQEGGVKISDDFASKVVDTLKDVLRDLGEEISKSGERGTESTVIVDIEFTSGTHKEYTFKIENNKLHLDGTPVADVDIQPSGEPHLSVDVLRKNLIDFFEKDLDFQDPADQDTAIDSDGNLLEIGDKIKVKSTILEIGFDSEKNTVYLESSNKKRVYGSDKAFKLLLESSHRIEPNPEDFEIDPDILDAELLKQIEDLEQDQRDRHAARNYDDAEAGVNEILKGALEIKVDPKHISLAKEVYKIGGYQSQHGILQTAADEYTAPGNDLETDLNSMEVFLEDLKKHGVSIKSETVSTALVPDMLQESVDVQVGDKVKISKDYGGARGKVVQKKGSFIVLDNGESYHQSDVVKVSRDFNEDLHIGHQDDEPGMLAQTVYEIANYAADVHKMLKFYESLGQDVNFPNWWQAKVILARDYIAKASHWLEYETRELDSTQGYLSERRKGKYNS